MNYKIDYNFLEISNTPSIEYYLEKRAREGWLIERIYLGSIFIFKKIEAAELEFSIQPYVLENDEWNYVTESYDLHIFYKEYKSEALSYELEAKEEFEIIETIGQKRIQGNWLQIILFLIMAWFNLGGIYTSPDFLKDGAAQLILPFILTGLAVSIWEVIHMKRFLKMNRENIDAGKGIEYSDSMFLVPSTTFFFASILFVLVLLHFLFLGISSKSYVPFIFILVILSLFMFGKAYRFWKQMGKTTEEQKKMRWAGGTVAVLIGLTFFSVYADSRTSKNPNLEEYKVLTADTFEEDQLEQDGSLWHDFSLVIPKSYKYYYISTEDEYVETEYSKTIMKDFAKDLTKRYINQKKIDYSNLYVDAIKLYFEEGTFNEYLTNIGINEGDLIRLKGLPQKEAEKTTYQIIEERSITKANTDLWNVDEAYFLSYMKDEILLRRGKEVFYLSGKDFTDATVIYKTMKKLALD